MPWYFFAAATPTLYGITNYIDKFLIDKKIKDPVAIAAFVSVISGIFGTVLLAFNHFTFIGIVSTSLLILAGLLLTGYLIPYYAALRSDETSRVAPLFQFIPMFSLILSSIFLKETLGIKQIVGLLLVVTAGFLLSANKIEAKIFKPRKSFWLMLLSTFMYGSIGILLRSVSVNTSYWVILSYEYIGAGIAGLLLLANPKIMANLKSQTTQIKSSIGIISLNNIITILAQMSETYAFTLVAVPLVNVIGAIHPFVVLLFGFILTAWYPHIVKEDVRKSVLMHKALSIAIIFSGLYLVYF